VYVQHLDVHAVHEAHERLTSRLDLRTACHLLAGCRGVRAVLAALKVWRLLCSDTLQQRLQGGQRHCQWK
jgi:hypothetical protein